MRWKRTSWLGHKSEDLGLGSGIGGEQTSIRPNTTNIIQGGKFSHACRGVAMPLSLFALRGRNEEDGSSEQGQRATCEQSRNKSVLFLHYYIYS